ncbi:hypothetical protein [Priestia megaterium]|uniref:hypothetical protein n=1 Tax=Priestia megaterium TaxID=1404 RepID=UPI001D2E72DE|nr:hypothetical protein [Priestia megaterium]CAH0309173.1 hypothetical protein SRABI82_04860 [Priestia megaterium]
MDVEIGLLPKSYISEIPESRGFFPFAIDGETPYIVEYESQETGFEHFLCNWMKNLNKFPIYSVFTYLKTQEEQIDNVFLSSNIEYVKFQLKNECFIKAKVTNVKQFKIVLSLIHSQGNTKDFAGWSLSEDLFSFEKRDMKTLLGIREVSMPVIKLQQNCTMFWVCYDGSFVTSISTDNLFSTSHSIINSFPSSIRATEFKYQ